MNAVAPPGLKAETRRAANRAAARGGEAGARVTVDYDEPADPLEAPATAPRPKDAPKDALKDALKDSGRAAGGGAAPAAGQSPVPPQLAAIEVALSVEVGSRMIPLRELLSVEPGQLFALDRMTSEPVTILVNGRPFARGEVVAIGERFGVRLLDLLPGAVG
ncbi:FliM/FliN family flagellar motor switch protein [Sandaracinobacter sp. RS1-74]|uniref:FliM/FliN family flagellar motor switch protein n=1 Tax=Sandaracinobacteroides sayramensis TaxID=2913411 RepID=UPI001EDC16C3|nr:FliM/FliN family flagellar motor switch protein [Sandaracinobacteroides sayramensis]MCG2841957.1 FliM/FliN family flagellar motor switch protein [Sandaracinobacteroides sayramensis]